MRKRGMSRLLCSPHFGVDVFIDGEEWMADMWDGAGWGSTPIRSLKAAWLSADLAGIGLHELQLDGDWYDWDDW